MVFYRIGGPSIIGLWIPASNLSHKDPESLSNLDSPTRNAAEMAAFWFSGVVLTYRRIVMAIIWMILAFADLAAVWYAIAVIIAGYACICMRFDVGDIK